MQHSQKDPTQEPIQNGETCIICSCETSPSAGQYNKDGLFNCNTCLASDPDYIYCKDCNEYHLIDNLSDIESRLCCPVTGTALIDDKGIEIKTV
jgi:hypothetical protein